MSGYSATLASRPCITGHKANIIIDKSRIFLTTVCFSDGNIRNLSGTADFYDDEYVALLLLHKELTFEVLDALGGEIVAS